MEVKRLELENDSYQKFINSEHDCLFVNDKLTAEKAKELSLAKHNMRRDNLLAQKIEALEQDIEEMNPITYTNPDNFKAKLTE
jgi:hypothetical protein